MFINTSTQVQWSCDIKWYKDFCSSCQIPQERKGPDDSATDWSSGGGQLWVCDQHGVSCALWLDPSAPSGMIQEPQFILGTQRKRGRQVCSRELSDLQIFFRIMTPRGWPLRDSRLKGCSGLIDLKEDWMIEISVSPSMKRCCGDRVDRAVANTRSVGLWAGEVYSTPVLSWKWAFWEGRGEVNHPLERRTWGTRLQSELRQGDVCGATLQETLHWSVVWLGPELWGPAVTRKVESDAQVPGQALQLQAEWPQASSSPGLLRASHLRGSGGSETSGALEQYLGYSTAHIQWAAMTWMIMIIQGRLRVF